MGLGSSVTSGMAHPPHPLTPYQPLAINAALTGMVPQRDRVPHVPVTPEQIAADAARCALAGASIVHLHARDAEGAPEWRRETYEQFIPAIRERCPDLVICVTTSGRTFGELERRADVLALEGDAKPDMASLTLGSLNFRDVASVNSPAMIEALAGRMLEAGVKPELEIFDSGMAYLAHTLLDRGLLEGPLYANLLLGSPNTAPARPGDLAALVAALPTGTMWAGAGIGAFQLQVNALSVVMGGHVRTGLEDNPHLHHSTREPATNVALVARAAQLAATVGRPLATPAQVRARLGLSPAAAPACSVRPALPADREAIVALAATLPAKARATAEVALRHELGRWHVAEAPAGIVAASTALPMGGELAMIVAAAPDAEGETAARALVDVEYELLADVLDRRERVPEQAPRPDTPPHGVHNLNPVG